MEVKGGPLSLVTGTTNRQALDFERSRSSERCLHLHQAPQFAVMWSSSRALGLIDARGSRTRAHLNKLPLHSSITDPFFLHLGFSHHLGASIAINPINDGPPRSA